MCPSYRRCYKRDCVQHGEYRQYFMITINGIQGFPDGSVVTNLPSNVRDAGGEGLIPDQEDPLEEKTATHSRFLLEKSHGQRSLVGYSLWGHRVRHNLATENEQQGTTLKNCSSQYYTPVTYTILYRNYTSIFKKRDHYSILIYILVSDLSH